MDFPCDKQSDILTKPFIQQPHLIWSPDNCSGWLSFRTICQRESFELSNSNTGGGGGGGNNASSTIITISDNSPTTARSGEHGNSSVVDTSLLLMTWIDEAKSNVEGALLDLNAFYYKRLINKVVFDGTIAHQNAFLSRFSLGGGISCGEGGDGKPLDIIANANSISRFESIFSDVNDVLFYPSTLRFTLSAFTPTHTFSSNVRALQEEVLNYAESQLDQVMRGHRAGTIAEWVVAVGLANANSTIVQQQNSDPESSDRSLVVSALIHHRRSTGLKRWIDEATNGPAVHRLARQLWDEVECGKSRFDDLSSALFGSLAIEPSRSTIFSLSATGSLLSLAADLLTGIVAKQIPLNGAQKAELECHQRASSNLSLYARLVLLFRRKGLLPEASGFYRWRDQMRANFQKCLAEAKLQGRNLWICALLDEIRSVSPDEGFWHSGVELDRCWYPPRSLLILLAPVLVLQIMDAAKIKLVAYFALDYDCVTGGELKLFDSVEKTFIIGQRKGAGLCVDLKLDQVRARWKTDHAELRLPTLPPPPPPPSSSEHPPRRQGIVVGIGTDADTTDEQALSSISGDENPPSDLRSLIDYPLLSGEQVARIRRKLLAMPDGVTWWNWFCMRRKFFDLLLQPDCGQPKNEQWKTDCDRFAQRLLAVLPKSSPQPTEKTFSDDDGLSRHHHHHHHHISPLGPSAGIRSNRGSVQETDRKRIQLAAAAGGRGGGGVAGFMNRKRLSANTAGGDRATMTTERENVEGLRCSVSSSNGSFERSPVLDDRAAKLEKALPENELESIHRVLQTPPSRRRLLLRDAGAAYSSANDDGGNWSPYQSVQATPPPVPTSILKTNKRKDVLEDGNDPEHLENAAGSEVRPRLRFNLPSSSSETSSFSIFSFIDSTGIGSGSGTGEEDPEQPERPIAPPSFNSDSGSDEEEHDAEDQEEEEEEDGEEDGEDLAARIEKELQRSQRPEVTTGFGTFRQQKYSVQTSMMVRSTTAPVVEDVSVKHETGKAQNRPDESILMSSYEEQTDEDLAEEPEEEQEKEAAEKSAGGDMAAGPLGTGSWSDESETAQVCIGEPEPVPLRSVYEEQEDLDELMDLNVNGDDEGAIIPADPVPVPETYSITPGTCIGYGTSLPGADPILQRSFEEQPEDEVLIEETDRKIALFGKEAFYSLSEATGRDYGKEEDQELIEKPDQIRGQDQDQDWDRYQDQSQDRNEDWDQDQDRDQDQDQSVIVMEPEVPGKDLGIEEEPETMPGGHRTGEVGTRDRQEQGGSANQQIPDRIQGTSRQFSYEEQEWWIETDGIRYSNEETVPEDRTVDILTKAMEYEGIIGEVPGPEPEAEVPGPEAKVPEPESEVPGPEAEVPGPEAEVPKLQPEPVVEEVSEPEQPVGPDKGNRMEQDRQEKDETTEEAKDEELSGGVVPTRRGIRRSTSLEPTAAAAAMMASRTSATHRRRGRRSQSESEASDVLLTDLSRLPAPIKKASASRRITVGRKTIEELMRRKETSGGTGTGTGADTDSGTAQRAIGEQEQQPPETSQPDGRADSPVRTEPTEDCIARRTRSSSRTRSPSRLNVIQGAGDESATPLKHSMTYGGGSSQSKDGGKKPTRKSTPKKARRKLNLPPTINELETDKTVARDRSTSPGRRRAKCSDEESTGTRSPSNSPSRSLSSRSSPARRSRSGSRTTSPSRNLANIRLPQFDEPSALDDRSTNESMSQPVQGTISPPRVLSPSRRSSRSSSATSYSRSSISEDTTTTATTTGSGTTSLASSKRHRSKRSSASPAPGQLSPIAEVSSGARTTTPPPSTTPAKRGRRQSTPRKKTPKSHAKETGLGLERLPAPKGRRATSVVSVPSPPPSSTSQSQPSKGTPSKGSSRRRSASESILHPPEGPTRKRSRMRAGKKTIAEIEEERSLRTQSLRMTPTRLRRLFD